MSVRTESALASNVRLAKQVRRCRTLAWRQLPQGGPENAIALSRELGGMLLNMCSQAEAAEILMVHMSGGNPDKQPSKSGAEAGFGIQQRDASPESVFIKPLAKSLTSKAGSAVSVLEQVRRLAALERYECRAHRQRRRAADRLRGTEPMDDGVEGASAKFGKTNSI